MKYEQMTNAERFIEYVRTMMLKIKGYDSLPVQYVRVTEKFDVVEHPAFLRK
jgi:hypothetical protein